MEKKPFTLSIEEKAINFNLLATDGKSYSLKDFENATVLVICFTCNHCPYVINSNEITRKTVLKYKEKNVAFVFINSNSKKTYEQDSYENMVTIMEKEKFPWTYLYDETQEIAKTYGALRTPHFFIFDKERTLVYTGRGNDSPRQPEKITSNELEMVLEALTKGETPPISLTNPIGCNVKWEGHDAHWMPKEACNLI